MVSGLRLALRLWKNRPAAAVAALLTIAIGTGLNVAVFHLIWSVLLRPLPYENPEQLVQLWKVDELADATFTPRDRRLPDPATVERWRERSRSFEAIATYRPWRVTLGSGGDPERIPAGSVSAEYFAVLGTSAQMGRTFTQDEMHAGADTVVVLSHGYWRQRFGGNRAVVDTSINVDGALHRVIGILSADFRDTVISGGNEPRAYVPISKTAEGRLKLSTGYTLARLLPGVDPAAAREELAALSLETASERGEPAERHGVSLTSLQEQTGASLRPALLALFAATGCVLLIACANLASLLLVQARRRRLELTVRSALGASRMRLVRQLLSEALVLAATGSLLGLAAAWALVRLMVGLYPGTIPRLDEGGAYAPVLGFSLALTVLSAVAFSVLPAWQSARQSQGSFWRWGAGNVHQRDRRWNGALVGVQVAITTVVLVTAGLLFKSFALLRSLDPGFARERILTAQVVLPEARYPGKRDQARFAREWTARLNSIPGVEAAAVTNSMPLAFNFLLSLDVAVPGLDGVQNVGARAVTGRFFDVMGLQLQSGRPLTPSDDDRSDVVVVNEAFARKFFPASEAAGQPLRFDKELRTIVGVVKDLRNLRLQRAAQPEVYMPFSVIPADFLDMAMRIDSEPAAVVGALRAELRSMDPGLALTQVSTMEEILDGSVARPRFQAVLMGLFAVVAMLLAAVGVYGVIADRVAARTAEFGVRKALGAGSFDLFRLVLRQGMAAPLLGLMAGLAGAVAAGRLVESLLFAVSSNDYMVYAAASVLLVAVASAACLVPARLAAGVEPSEALRHE